MTWGRLSTHRCGLSPFLCMWAWSRHSSEHVSSTVRRGCQPEGHCEKQKGGHWKYSIPIAHPLSPWKGPDSQVTGISLLSSPGDAGLMCSFHGFLPLDTCLWLLCTGAFWERIKRHSQERIHTLRRMLVMWVGTRREDGSVHLCERSWYFVGLFSFFQTYKKIWENVD